MSLDDSLHLATADALHSNHLERARILLAIALRAEISDEEARLSAALAGGRARPTTINRKLAPLLPLWQKEQPERAPGVEKLASRIFAYAAADDDEPFASYAKPTPTDAATLITNSFFRKDAERVQADAASGRGLLPPQAVGATTCDLVAALVQLLLAAPFAPCIGFASDMLLALLAALRVATRAAADAPLEWAAVALLSERQLRHALRDGLADDFFYEADEAAEACWRRARAARLCALLRGLKEGKGSVTLGWLRSSEAWAGLRALLELPAVTLPVAAALLLFELRQPIFPVCCNALQEAKACGWVPPHAGATAAFLHLNARLPKDPVQLRALYGCLCQQHAFRLTRQAVVGSGDKAPTAADIAYRERRGAYALQRPVRLAPTADGGDDEPVSDDEGVAGGDAALLVIDSPAAAGPLLPLASVVTEHLNHHELYPEVGCTPLVLALRPVDARTAEATAAAWARGALPQQQRPGEGAGLRYVVDVPWSVPELTAGALLLAPLEDGATPLVTQLTKLSAREEECGAAGPCLFGFGEHLESGAHLAAKCDRAHTLTTMLERDEGSLARRDAQGRQPLHTACAAGAYECCALLLARGADAAAADRAGWTPLSLAAAAGARECCAMLVDHGASLQPPAGTAPLEAAASSGALEVVRLLLGAKADVDAQDTKTGRTAAHAAARHGHLDVVSLLVREHCASLTLCDRSGRCAWEVTPDAVHAEAVWLVEAGKSAVRASGATKLAAAPPKESSLMALVD